MGLFVGPAFTEEDDAKDGIPSHIYIFVSNLKKESNNNEVEFRKQVRITYLHELGHYLGLEEEDLTIRGLD